VYEIDQRTIADGEIGPLTAKIQDVYAKAIRGNHPKYMKWCTPVYKK